MITLEGRSNTAIIVLHEIYGVNRHILNVCKEYHLQGYDVYCPDLLGDHKVYSYELHVKAYEYFIGNVGFGVYQEISLLVKRLASEYEQVFIVGFSIGATLAWLVAAAVPCNGIVCHYGSRIRDYLSTKPKCPVLLIMARQDEAYLVSQVQKDLEGTPNIVLEIFEGAHGFCDPYTAAYHSVSADSAKQMTHEFINDLIESKKDTNLKSL